jgi:glycosyltransferase involved in cell wall biosynthesis
MRILVANDGANDAGGVQAYLDSVLTPLEAIGHEIALVSENAARSAAVSSRVRFHVGGATLARDLEPIRRWQPDVCYSHNMRDLSVDAGLMTVAPVVKFMHGYFGTCVGGLKMHAFPTPVSCDRTFGIACAALYLPRRCGRLSPAAMVRDFRWSVSQRDLLARYAAIVVASGHMRREYENNGAPVSRLHTNPLFPTRTVERERRRSPAEPRVVFLGRMTALKGGDLLVRAVARASSRLGRPVELTMVGDGPQRHEWEALAHRLGVRATFTGWLAGAARWPHVADASILAISSVWPEPFGLVGLEAAALGVPAIATDTGGISEWLHHDVNGVLVPTPASASTFGDRLAALLSDPERLDALGAGASKRACEMSVDAHVSRLAAVLQAVRTEGNA